MENKQEELEFKKLLQKGTQVLASNDFTINMMQRIEEHEKVQEKPISYFKISFVLILIVIVLGFFMLKFISTMSCQLLAENCELVSYVFVALLAAGILVQFNFLITRFNQYRRTIV